MIKFSDPLSNMIGFRPIRSFATITEAKTYAWELQIEGSASRIAKLPGGQHIVYPQWTYTPEETERYLALIRTGILNEQVKQVKLFPEG